MPCNLRCMLVKKLNPSAAKQIALTDEALSLLNLPMPHDVELEKAILGACLMDIRAIFIVKRYFKSPEVFYHFPNQTIYQALLEMLDQKVNIDILTVTDKLRKQGLLVRGGDEQADKKQKLFGLPLEYLLELSSMVSSPRHVESHCLLVYEFYMRRKGIVEGLTLARNCANPTMDVFVALEDMTREARFTIPGRMLKVECMNESIDRGSEMERKKMILGNLLKTDEIAFLFGDEGTGKSILAFQMGDAASRGVDLFPDLEDPDLKNQCEPLDTILIDFELDEDELFDRYNYKGEKYLFNERFKRSYISTEFLDFEDADQHLMNEIEEVIELHKPKLVIIDNITYISTESSDPTIATKFMKRLKGLQRSRHLSILVVAHTVKTRDKSLPLESRHMTGASGLKNFAKSIIAVGNSFQDPDIRYIKHLKCRNGLKLHDHDNVIECNIDKPGSQLHFEYLGLGKEKQHLLMADEGEKKREAIEFAYECRKEKGTGLRTLSTLIEEQFNVRISHTTLGRKLNEYKQKYDMSSWHKEDETQSPSNSL